MENEKRQDEEYAEKGVIIMFICLAQVWLTLVSNCSEHKYLQMLYTNVCKHQQYIVCDISIKRHFLQPALGLNMVA